MEPLIIALVVVALVVVIGGIYLWSTYNSLVTLNVRVDEAWSDITVQLKRRADLIPNLIETVKGYAAHEKGVFEDVTKARAETLSATGPAEAAKAEGHMQSALKSIFAVAEAYPQLHASENFLALQGSSPTPKTRFRQPAGSITVACASSTPRFSSSPTTCGPRTSSSSSATSSTSPTLRPSLSHPACSSRNPSISIRK